MLPSLARLRVPETVGGRVTAGRTRKAKKRPPATAGALQGADPADEPVTRGPIDLAFGRGGDPYFVEMAQTAALQNMCRNEKTGDEVLEGYIRAVIQEGKRDNNQLWVVTSRKAGESRSHPTISVVGSVVAFAIVSRHYDSFTNTSTVLLDLICASSGSGQGIRLFKKIVSHYTRALHEESMKEEEEQGMSETTRVFEIHPINEVVAKLYEDAVLEELGVRLQRLVRHDEEGEEEIIQTLIVDRDTMKRAGASLSIVDQMDTTAQAVHVLPRRPDPAAAISLSLRN